MCVYICMYVDHVCVCVCVCVAYVCMYVYVCIHAYKAAELRDPNRDRDFGPKTGERVF